MQKSTLVVSLVCSLLPKSPYPDCLYFFSSSLEKPSTRGWKTGTYLQLAAIEFDWYTTYTTVTIVTGPNFQPNNSKGPQKSNWAEKNWWWPTFVDIDQKWLKEAV